MKKALLLFIIILSVLSCATLPKATVDLSIMLEQQINALEKANIAISKDYFELKKEKALQLLDNEWYPNFLDNFFQQSIVQEHWDSILTAKNNIQKIILIKDLTEAIQMEYMNKRDSLLYPLEVAEKEWLELIQQEYQMAKTMNNAITLNVKSIHDLQEKRKEILSKLDKKNAIEKKLDIFTLQANSVLENIEKGINVYKTNESSIDKFINKLKK